jgi:hypothetical protein
MRLGRTLASGGTALKADWFGECASTRRCALRIRSCTAVGLSLARRTLGQGQPGSTTVSPDTPPRGPSTCLLLGVEMYGRGPGRSAGERRSRPLARRGHSDLMVLAGHTMGWPESRS